MGPEEHTTAESSKFQVERRASVYRDALLDAALTVQRWRRLYPSNRWVPSHRCWNVRVMRYIAHRLGCYPEWDSIQAEIVRRNVAVIVGEARP